MCGLEWSVLSVGLVRSLSVLLLLLGKVLGGAVLGKRETVRGEGDTCGGGGKGEGEGKKCVRWLVVVDERERGGE